jgi:signal peptidase II
LNVRTVLKDGSPVPLLRQSLRRPALAVILLTAIDQCLKALVVARYAQGETHTLLPGLAYLTYQTNDGAAFSLLRGAPVWLLPLVTCVVLAVFLVLARPYLRRGLGLAAATLIFSGAIGNLIDRVLRRHVVDYIDMHTTAFQYPIFNLADSLVVMGVGLLVLAALRTERRDETAQGGEG